MTSSSGAKSKGGGRSALPDFPCGCVATVRGSNTILVMADGSRMCAAHGKRWRFGWVAVPGAASVNGAKTKARPPVAKKARSKKKAKASGKPSSKKKHPKKAAKKTKTAAASSGSLSTVTA